MTHPTATDVRFAGYGGAGVLVALIGLVFANQAVNPNGPPLWKNPWWIYGMAASGLTVLAALYTFVASSLDLPMPPQPAPGNRATWRRLATTLVVIALGPPVVILLWQTNLYRNSLTWIVVLFVALVLVLVRNRVRVRELDNQISEAQGANAELSRDLTNVKTDLDRICGERDSAKEELAVTKSQLVALNAEHDSMTAEMEERLTSEREAARAELSEAVSQRDALRAKLDEIEREQGRLRPWLIARAKRIRAFLTRSDVTVADYLQEFNYGEISGVMDRLKNFPMDSTKKNLYRHELVRLPSSKEDVEAIADALESLAFDVPEDALV